MNCVMCGDEILRFGPKAKYCSKACSSKDSKEKFAKMNPRAGGPNVASATVGAMAELRVAVDLMSRGFQVLRAMSIASACDLAIFLGERAVASIEVRTAYRMPSGKVYCSQWNHRSEYLAQVLPDQIIYTPELPPVPDLAQPQKHNRRTPPPNRS